MKMIEMRMREQDQINRGQIADFEASPFDSLQQEKPVGEVRIDQHIQVRVLHQKRCVADPRQGHVALFQLRELRPAMLAFAASQQRFPHHLVEKRARIEVVARG